MNYLIPIVSVTAAIACLLFSGSQRARDKMLLDSMAEDNELLLNQIRLKNTQLTILKNKAKRKK